MQKERAASALKHGLPVPTPPPARVRITDVASSVAPSSAPRSDLGLGGAPPPSRMPLAVKLLGIGLGVLGVIYGLTVFRDHRSQVANDESRAASDSRQAAPAATTTAAPAPTFDQGLLGAPLTIPSAALAPRVAAAPALAPVPSGSFRMHKPAPPPSAHSPSSTVPVTSSATPASTSTPKPRTVSPPPAADNPY